jgi:DNA-binding PadR family transcriptional regulator
MHQEGMHGWKGGRARQRRRGPWFEEWNEGWPGRQRRGPRMRRGDIRWALLEALGDGPAHGYELIVRLEDRSGGMWRPSPGSVYPTLQMLEDEGLVRSEERDAKRVYELTEAGRTAAAEHADGRAESDAAEERVGGPARHRAMRGVRLAGETLGPALPPLLMAAKQVAMTGDDSQLERAQQVLRRATKELNQILAED